MVQNRGPEQLLINTCVTAFVPLSDLSRPTKVRWVLGYLYNCNYKDGERLDGFYVICITAVNLLPFHLIRFPFCAHVFRSIFRPCSSRRTKVRWVL